MKILRLLVFVILIAMLPAIAVGHSVPSAFIGSPVHYATFLTTDSITFRGSGDEAKGGNLIGDSLVWTSDIDGQIGTGESFTRSLTVGHHVITLTVTDSDGHTGDAIVTIMVSPPPPPPPTTPEPTEVSPVVPATPEPTTPPESGGTGGTTGGTGSGPSGGIGTPIPPPTLVVPPTAPVPPTTAPPPTAATQVPPVPPTTAPPSPAATPVPAPAPQPTPECGGGDTVGNLALKTGCLAFRAPDEMTVGKWGEVVVVISKTTAVAALEIRLNEEAGGIIGGEEVEYSENMKAILTGLDFEIENAEQIKGFLGDEVEWKWQVKPEEAGEQRLTIEVFALVIVEGNEIPQQIAVFEHPLNIKVEPWNERFQDFWSQNWQWAFTVILVPMGALIFRRMRKT